MIRKTLISVSYLPTAEQTLRWGARLTQKFNSDLTLLYVSNVPQRGPLHTNLTRQKMGEWGIEPPSFRLLRQAEALLKQEGALQLDERGRELERHAFKALYRGVGEVHLTGVHGGNVRLRLREGPVVDEIVKEVEDPAYDLIFIGTRGQRGLRRYLLGNIAHDVAMQAPCSVLVSKGLAQARALLVGVTGRESSKEALRQGVELAQALSLPLRLISIYPQAEQRPGAQKHLDEALALVDALGYEAEPLLVAGEPAKTMIETAGQDHVLALGRAPMSLVQRVFLGDVSQKILNKGHCSVLIAVPPRDVQA